MKTESVSEWWWWIKVKEIEKGGVHVALLL